MALCFLTERRLLDYFSNHLLSTEDTKKPKRDNNILEIKFSIRETPLRS